MQVDRSGNRQTLSRSGVAVVCAMLLAGAAPPAAAAPPAGDLQRAVLAAAAAALPGHGAGAVQGGGGPAGASCAGDCNGDGRISVDELVRAVSIALGLVARTACASLDANGDQRVDITEVIGAVSRALEGCSPGGESVCGGPITSAPKLCALTVTPRITTAFGTLRISFSLSDLEGDLIEICGAVAPQGTEPPLDCDPLEPEGATINAVLELPPIRLNGARNGTYVLYLQLRDAAGARSALESATFTVGVRA